MEELAVSIPLVVFMCLCLCESAGGGGDNIADTAARRKNVAVNTTSDSVIANRTTKSCRYYDNDYDNDYDDDDDIMAPVLYRVRPARYIASRPCVCLSVCQSAHHTSINTSLYPMIGSCCTTSSCHVDSLPRPSTNHDCSSTCYSTVYEYALDSYSRSIPGLSLDSVVVADSSEMTVDCNTSVTKGAAAAAPESLKSWSTVHSAPAVLDRLRVFQGHDGRAAAQPRAPVRRDEFCSCYHHAPFYYSNAAAATRYDPLTYRPTYTAADDHNAADDNYDDDDDDNGCYDKLPAASSLRVAKPVLAETQYWV